MGSPLQARAQFSVPFARNTQALEKIKSWVWVRKPLAFSKSDSGAEICREEKQGPFTQPTCLSIYLHPWEERCRGAVRGAEPPARSSHSPAAAPRRPRSTAGCMARPGPARLCRAARRADWSSRGEGKRGKAMIGPPGAAGLLAQAPLLKSLEGRAQGGVAPSLGPDVTRWLPGGGRAPKATCMAGQSSRGCRARTEAGLGEHRQQ